MPNDESLLSIFTIFKFILFFIIEIFKNIMSNFIKKIKIQIISYFLLYKNATDKRIFKKLSGSNFLTNL